MRGENDRVNTWVFVVYRMSSAKSWAELGMTDSNPGSNTAADVDDDASWCICVRAEVETSMELPGPPGKGVIWGSSAREGGRRGGSVNIGEVECVAPPIPSSLPLVSSDIVVLFSFATPSSLRRRRLCVLIVESVLPILASLVMRCLAPGTLSGPLRFGATS